MPLQAIDSLYSWLPVTQYMGARGEVAPEMPPKTPKS